ncbi:MAG: hypothetical protein PVH88_01565 [Ignavibacteria bacterium]|jgi:hypothetical protein
MIESITNSAKVETGFIQLKPSSGFKNIPAVNSTVLVNVLDKIGANYKLLISGSVYQSRLPVAAEKGEEFLAKVMSQQPLTLGLDNFTKFNQVDNNGLSLLLTKLNIAETNLTTSLLEKVISSKKPLIKSKLKRLIELVENSDIKIDDIQMQLLISIIWNLSTDNFKNTRNVFENIFDISFEELSKKIFDLIQASNTLNLPQSYYDLLNSKIILDISTLNSMPKTSAVRDKSAELLNVIHFIDANRSLYVNNKTVINLFNDMKVYLLKYIIQKAFYAKFNLYPEFVIVKRDQNLELINYRIEEQNKNSFMMISKIDYGNDESLFLQGVYANDKFIGEAIVTERIKKVVDSHLTVLNKKIEKVLKVISDIKSKMKGIAADIEGDSITIHQPVNINI